MKTTRTSGELVEVSLGSPPGGRYRMGLVALATDQLSETDLRAMLPDDVALFVSRVLNADEINAKTLSDIGTELTAGVERLLPGDDIQLIAYGCTSGTVVLGEHSVFNCIKKVRPNVFVTTPPTAVRAALRALGASRINVITPYHRDLHETVCDMVCKFGIEIVADCYFGLERDSQIIRVEPKEILRTAIKIHKNNKADALFISCTGLRSAEIAGLIEKEINRPVVTSNQAMVWHALELMQVTARRGGFGKLMALHTVA